MRQAGAINLPSPNVGDRPPGEPIDILLLHYTGMKTASDAIARLRDPEAQVSAHYVVDEDGALYCLVDEDMRAWHAGVSGWAGRTGLNDVSIGVEIVNPGHEFGYRPFPERQMQAVIALCQGILNRWPIPPGRVLGHSDVAPDRKEDPGELFDWARLARAGIGLWPDMLPPGAAIDPADMAAVRDGLRRYGYPLKAGEPDTTAISTVVTAFQRHFRPGRIDGHFDDDCADRLSRLIAAVD